MDIPWTVTKTKLGAEPCRVLTVTTMEREIVDREIASMPACDCVVGIGGGQAIDYAKYFSWKRDIRLVTIPTVISVDAFVTPASGLRCKNDVIYVGTSTPDPLVIDYDVIRTAPRELNVAGIGDILSIHTATFDWELAASRGKSEYPFDEESIGRARQLLQSSVFDKIADIRGVTDDGLWSIVEGYMTINTICLPLGHYRVEEGSEHYLFYALEKKLKRSFIHGHIVGLGVYLMSRLQKNDFLRIDEVMNSVGLKYQPVDMGLSRRDVKEALQSLKQFVANRSDLWFTVIDDKNITEEWIETSLEGLSFAPEL
ncbi:glycerol-1-phosphate dehydrogenase [NAD(P)+]-like [Oscarella lobularis]|uniref:glycerol-1-phosphate dehydrogenase [NAD(P)+]-like n=1 Tax=Oscarella lobularis TaxID=121494 RepID=UPI0033133B55